MQYYQYFPELDYWFSQAIIDHIDLTEYRINLPEAFNVTENYYYQTGSVFELMFRDIFPYDSYLYTFKEYTSSTFPKKIIDRLNIKNTQCKSYLSYADTTETPYSFSETELSLLDELLKYKNGVEPDLSIVDSTGGLDTKLSYYMYYYMDTMVNRSYSWLSNLSTINDLYPTSTFLEDLYELYTLNLVHTEIKDWTTLMDSTSVHMYPVRTRNILTENQVSDENIIIDRPLPYNTDDIKFWVNGERVANSIFTITLEADEMILEFDNTVANLKIEDVLLLDYYAAIDTYTYQTTEEPEVQYKGEI